MAGYIRRFLVDPGEDVLLEIESVNILDLDPPASISGVGSGTVLQVGEFEDGPFAAVTGVTTDMGVFEVGSATDLRNLFGSFGFTYDGVPNNNPCARSRKADGAVNPEFWNGNGIIAFNGKKFRRVLIGRVDTSVGSVSFSRIAYAPGSTNFAFDLESAEHLDFKLDGGSSTVVTFTGTVATVTGSAAAFGTIVAGETAILGYDGAPDFTVVFLAADTTIGAVVSRINTYAGYTMASNAAGQLKLDGRVKGTSGQVRVVGGTAVTKLGLTVANTAGGGNVANVDAISSTELSTLVTAAAAGASVVRDSSQRIRLQNNVTPLTGTIEVLAASSSNVLTQLGLTVGVYRADSGHAGFIPAGTRVGVVAGQQFVTMQSIPVTAGSAGPYSVKIRHALDDGTGLSALVATIVAVTQQPDIDSFVVTNPLPTVAALTEPQIDAKYAEALGQTMDLNSVARETNIIWSARQSNACRRAVRDNCRDASANGCFGRVGCIRPPLGATRTQARSTSVEPGVGATRDQRVIYNYPGVSMQVPAIQLRGTAGGAGFTATGVIDGGSDGFCASVMSQLSPEENPGQLTEFTGAILGLESSPNAAGFSITDYINLKASGICAPRMDEGVAIFQSGVTSVDPSSFPNLKTIARRRMADYIQDTLARRFKPYSKKLATIARRQAIMGETVAFLTGLLGDPRGLTPQRIAGFIVDVKSGNTKASLAKGLFRIIVRVQTISSLDSIVVQTTIGESVDVTELAA